MNWKLILLLALFGIAMGLGTVFFVPSWIEPFVWLAVFLVSAYVIVKNVARRRFLHGLLVGLFDSLLKTSVHVMLFSAYVSRHPQEIAMIHQMTSAVTPLQLIVLTSPVWGLIYGTATGLLALLLGLFVRPAESGSAAA